MLKFVVAGLGVLILVALGALVGGLIWQASKVNSEAQDGLPSTATPAATSTTPFGATVQSGGGWAALLDVPAGAKLEAQALDGRRLIVRSVHGDDQTLWVVDVATGRVIGKIAAGQ